MVDLAVARLLGWLIDLLVGGRLVGWLVGWLAGCPLQPNTTIICSAAPAANAARCARPRRPRSYDLRST
eukprot:355707-Chlamydomonas_euryale.AAC.1